MIFRRNAILFNRRIYGNAPMKSNSFLADQSIQYQQFCQSITPGMELSEDLDKSFAISFTGNSEIPTRADFTPVFFRAVYNYYAQQLSKPLLGPNDKRVYDNQSLVENVKSLMTSVDADHRRDKGLTSLGDLLGNNLIIGEITHNAVTPKKFLIENMQALKDAGCNTLYIEHLTYDDLQSSLDRFNQGGRLDPKVQQKLQYFDHGNSHTPAYTHADASARQALNTAYREEWKKNNFTALVNAAHAAGMRIVAIDIKDLYYTQTQSGTGGFDPALPVDRIITGDYSFANIIHHDQATHPNSGKWVALIGAAHVKGLERLLHQETVAVLAGDRDINMTELNCRNKDLGAKFTQTHRTAFEVDAILTVPVGGDVPLLQQQLTSANKPG